MCLHAHFHDYRRPLGLPITERGLQERAERMQDEKFTVPLLNGTKLFLFTPVPFDSSHPEPACFRTSTQMDRPAASIRNFCRRAEAGGGPSRSTNTVKYKGGLPSPPGFTVYVNIDT